MAANDKSFSEEVFMYREYNGETPFLVAYDDLEEAAENAGEEEEIATYVLKHVAKYRVDKIINEL